MKQYCFKLLMLSVFILGSGAKACAALGDVITSFAVPGAPICDPRGLAWDGTNLWYADAVANSIFKLDPSTGAVLDSFASPNLNPAGLAYDSTSGQLWNMDIFVRTFYTIDPGTGASNAEFTKLANDFYGLAWDGTNLWASDGGAGGDIIVKMDTSGNVLDTLPFPNNSPADIAWDGTNLWVADGNNIIYKLDPVTGVVLDSFTGPGVASVGLTFDGDNLWVSDIGTSLIYQVDDGAPPVSSPTPAPIPLITMAQGIVILAFVLRRKKAA